ncbi:hypothetical protein BC374_12605 [Ensifer sp. LC13]|nr:hypothetical protein BC362_02565 [Ensifer sp. LC14]OCP13675.1 hypothetical protein BC374_12605 [Ensifer sp. LC13]OCP14332.1 hypothetical protein BBX50_12885 [Ensifer sp. LC11]OCP29037.1 hypothetical protein BC364_11005 [Ensifer sp. LC499]
MGVTALGSALYFFVGPETTPSEIAAIDPAEVGAGIDASMTATPNFEILFSDGDRGLMVFEGYVYVVRLGDKLPNGKRMIGFQKRDGNWAAVTL